MFDNRKDDEVFSRRAVILGGMKLGLVSLLIGRLHYLQLQKTEEYTTMAEDNRVNVEPVAPSRGIIYDRFGRFLANNQADFRLIFIPEQAENPRETISRLSKIIDLPISTQEKIMRRVERQPKFLPHKISENMDWGHFARLNIERPFLPGVEPQVGERRVYPFGYDTAHIIGYVGASQSTKQRRAVAGLVQGRTGIEFLQEENLRGAIGNRHIEVNARGRIIRELARDNGKPGSYLHLTIDLTVQKYVMEKLADHHGTAAVLDVDTGAVIALASAPSFDPNQLSYGIENRQWQRLRNDPGKPLLNKALAGQYSPGSTFKIIVALAALMNDIITPDEEISCNGVYELGREKFHCWEEKGHGRLNFISAMEKSCDVYFYEIARRIGIDNIEDTAQKFGLGRVTDIDLPGEKPALMPGRKWKRETFGEEWQIGDTIVVGIGQGYVLVTPLQLAHMIATLANGEQRHKPFIVDKIDGRPVDRAPPIPLAIPRAHIALVKQGLFSVVNGEEGTARASRFEVDGKLMAGKTGTVQVRRISATERETGVLKSEELPKRLRDHSVFIGYAPHDKPRYAISVFVEHGGNGSAVAAPIASDILKFILKKEHA